VSRFQGFIRNLLAAIAQQEMRKALLSKDCFVKEGTFQMPTYISVFRVVIFFLIEKQLFWSKNSVFLMIQLTRIFLKKKARFFAKNAVSR